MTDFHYTVRKACEGDRRNIAKTIACSFEKDFSSLHKDMERIANIIEPGILTEHFFVAEQDGELIGIIACTDCTQRAVYVAKSDCRAQLGLIRGFFGYKVFYSEMMEPLSFPSNTGFIEIVGVLERARGKGVASHMLKGIIEGTPKYNEFILDVTDTNPAAQKCYTGFGFKEFDRIPVKFAKQKGFNCKIFMKYSVPS